MHNYILNLPFKPYCCSSHNLTVYILYRVRLASNGRYSVICSLIWERGLFFSACWRLTLEGRTPWGRRVEGGGGEYLLLRGKGVETVGSHLPSAPSLHHLAVSPFPPLITSIPARSFSSLFRRPTNQWNLQGKNCLYLVSYLLGTELKRRRCYWHGDNFFLPFILQFLFSVLLWIPGKVIIKKEVRRRKETGGRRTISI